MLSVFDLSAEVALIAWRRQAVRLDRWWKRRCRDRASGNSSMTSDPEQRSPTMY